MTGKLKVERDFGNEKRLTGRRVKYGKEEHK